LDDGEYGIVWCPAVITAVLVDSWLHAKITNPRYGEGEQAEWEDWFSWVEEGKDWRREGWDKKDDDEEDDSDDSDSDSDSDEEDDDGEEKTYPKVRLVFKGKKEAPSTGGGRYSIPKLKSQPPESEDAPAASAGAASSAGAAASASFVGAAAAQYYEETRDGSTPFSWREYERATMETDAAALGTRRGTKLRTHSPVAGKSAAAAEPAPKAEAEAGAGSEAKAGVGEEAQAGAADGVGSGAEAEREAVDAAEGGGPSQED
jgi:hypothetical protein